VDKAFYVYVLASRRNGTLYAGITEAANPYWNDLYPQIAGQRHWVPAFVGTTAPWKVDEHPY